MPSLCPKSSHLSPPSILTHCWAPSCPPSIGTPLITHHSTLRFQRKLFHAFNSDLQWLKHLQKPNHKPIAAHLSLTESQTNFHSPSVSLRKSRLLTTMNRQPPILSLLNTHNHFLKPSTLQSHNFNNAYEKQALMGTTIG